jgi:RimJ/RimL family protein N-acetyltransferase
MEHAGYPLGLLTTEEKILDQLKDSPSKRLIIELNTIPIGEMSYREISNGVVEIGIKICDFSKQNQGFGTRYLYMLLNYLFNNLNYSKVVLDTNLNNKRAQHVYEKIGFKKIRINHNSWINQIGELQSSVDYEFYKENYNKAKN